MSVHADPLKRIDGSDSCTLILSQEVAERTKREKYRGMEQFTFRRELVGARVEVGNLARRDRSFSLWRARSDSELQLPFNSRIKSGLVRNT